MEKKTTEGLFVFLRLRKKCFFSVLEISHICGQGYGYGKKDLLWGLTNSKKRQLLKAVKKMMCGQVSKEEKKRIPPPQKNDCVVFFFNLAGSVGNCILIVFVMCLRQTQTKNLFPHVAWKFKFLLQELNVAIFVWKKQICRCFFTPLWKKLLLFGMISISITFWFKRSTTKYDILWNPNYFRNVCVGKLKLRTHLFGPKFYPPKDYLVSCFTSKRLQRFAWEKEKFHFLQNLNF